MKALIIGGGIGGLATALCLHDKGIEVEVFERSREIRELGVGINTLPHAIKELADLGLLEALDAVAIRTHELIYTNRLGQEIWREPRGLDAGYDVPQFSIHRGRLQGVLHEAVLERIGDDNVHTGHDCVDFTQDDERRRRISSRAAKARGRCERRRLRRSPPTAFIRASGPGSIPMKARRLERHHAVARRRRWPPFLTGRSMVIAGGMDAKLVLYPISNDTGDPDKVLMNWAVGAKLGDGSGPPPRREDWSREGRLDEVLPFVENVFSSMCSIRGADPGDARHSSSIPCATATRSRNGPSAG